MQPALPVLFLLLTDVLFAQTPPAGVDQALRARVIQFYQSYVDGSFRKALDLVAEDSTDAFFASSKSLLKSFKAESIKYSENFTKAEVLLTTQRMWRVSAQFPETLVTAPLASTWKMEAGRWVWYVDPKTESKSGGKDALPDLSPDGIAAAGQKILGQSKTDKNEVRLPVNRSSSDQVVFHNGFPGAVRVTLEDQPFIPGFSAEVDKAILQSGENAILKIRFEPVPGAPKPSGNTIVRLLLEPFAQAFPVTVTFVSAGDGASKP